jgi:hypothetical protein
MVNPVRVMVRRLGVEESASWCKILEVSLTENEEVIILSSELLLWLAIA